MIKTSRKAGTGNIHIHIHMCMCMCIPSTGNFTVYNALLFFSHRKYNLFSGQPSHPISINKEPHFFRYTANNGLLTL